MIGTSLTKAVREAERVCGHTEHAIRDGIVGRRFDVPDPAGRWETCYVQPAVAAAATPIEAAVREQIVAQLSKQIERLERVQYLRPAYTGQQITALKFAIRVARGES